MGRPKPIRAITSIEERTERRDRLFMTGSPFASVERSQIVGIDALVEQLDETVLWLKKPEWFVKFSSRLEPGILFSGDPGTGKTMVARYLASCSDALFIAVRDWPVSGDMVTASDVADLFRRAREHYSTYSQPVLIFWDEFEIYAKRRSDSPARDASVVSQLMSELDGVNGKCTGILFIGSTNYPAVIDTALKRHGRLGKHFQFTAPDRRGKMLLLEHYLKKHGPTAGLDLESASYFLPKDASAAAIEEACEGVWRKALVIALGGNSVAPVVTQAILNDVLLEELLGPPPPFTEFSQETERRVALHELGHAIAAKTLGVPIQVMTIRPGSNNFGRVVTYSDEELGIFNARQHHDQITVGLAGMAMEVYMGLAVSSGVEGDTKAATNLVIGLVEKLGQHSWINTPVWVGPVNVPVWVGPVNVPALEQRASYSEGPILSQELLGYFDREENGILRNSYRQAYSLLEGIGKDKIERLADRFVEAKTWTGKDFDRVYANIVERSAVPV